MSDRINAWELFDRAWRSAIAALWRLALPVWSTVLLYAVFASAISELLPFADRQNVVLGTFDALAYDLLHALVYAPLMFAVIDWILRGNTHSPELWTDRMGRFVLWLLAGQVLAICLTLAGNAIPIWRWESASRSVAELKFWEGLAFVRMIATYLVLLIIWMRVGLLLPAIVMGGNGSLGSAVRIWTKTKGHTAFALTASLLTVAPYVVADSQVTRLLRRYSGGVSLHTVFYWENLLLRSVERMTWYLLWAALLAWLWRAIAAREQQASEGISAAAGSALSPG